MEGGGPVLRPRLQVLGLMGFHLSTGSGPAFKVATVNPEPEFEA